MELVNVKNLDPDKPLVLKHDEQGDITIPAGGERVVPLDHASIAFGHPATKNDGRDDARDRMYAATRTYWGFYPGIDTEDDWEDIGPHFEVYSLDGERIFMVLDDPTGEKSNPEFASSADLTNSAAVEKAMADMQKQIEQMQKIIVAGQAGDASAAELPTPAATEVADGSKDSKGDKLPDSADHADDQTERNEKRDELPKPVRKVVSKDKPRTTRSGGR